MRRLAFLLSLGLIFTIPWENAITISSLGTLTRLMGLLTTGIWLFSVLIVGQFRKLHAFHIAAFLFIFWNVVSIFWSVDIDETLVAVKTYLQLAILIWILWDLYTTQNDLHAAMQAYILGAYIAIGSTIYNQRIGQQISEYSGGRFAGANLNAVDLVLILILGLPIAWYLATSKENGAKNHFLKLVNYVYIPAAIFASILTASRTTFFIIVPAIVYILGTGNQLKPVTRILVFLILMGALITFQPFIPQSTVNRLVTVGDSIGAFDLGGRAALWRGAFTIFLEHPLLGIGGGALDTFTELRAVAHNTFLSVAAELGVIGLSLLIIMLSFVMYQAIIQQKLLSRLWLTVLAIWAIGALSLTWEYRKPTWLVMSLIIISGSLYNRQEKVIGVSRIPDEQFVQQDTSIISGETFPLNQNIPDRLR